MLKIPGRVSEAALARLRRRFQVREESEGVAFAVEKMLGLPAAEARKLAQAGSARRMNLYSACISSPPARALSMLRGIRPSSDLSPLVEELGRHAEDSYVLALPLTVDAVLLLERLAADERRRFVIMNTPLTRAYLRPLVESSEGGRVSFVSSGEMVMHNRVRAGGGQTGTVTYVTFPDHQGTRGDTMWRIPFLSDRHKFSTVEPLLFFRGLPLLFTLGAEEAGGLTLARYAQGAETAAASEAEVRAVLDWLARQLETVFRRQPAEVLSWEFAQERSSRLTTQITVMKLKTIEGYVRAWGEAGAGLDASSYDWAVAELRKLQEVTYNSAEPQGVAS